MHEVHCYTTNRASQHTSQAQRVIWASNFRLSLVLNRAHAHRTFSQSLDPTQDNSPESNELHDIRTDVSSLCKWFQPLSTDWAAVGVPTEEFELYCIPAEFAWAFDSIVSCQIRKSKVIKKVKVHCECQREDSNRVRDWMLRCYRLQYKIAWPCRYHQGPARPRNCKPAQQKTMISR